MNTQMITTDLIAALEVQRQAAVAYDRDELKAHKLACREAAATRRKYLRDLIALPDDELAEYDRYRAMPEGSSCPLSKVEQIDNALGWLKRDRRKTMTVADTDLYGKLLTWSATPRSATVCK